ncbi:hypothetical protein JXB28_00375 [Candidatus Woesearchaeota archaeon]|nr:hypothetical protein [Candidatus Woesearchaeota archaeon]
MVLTISSVSLGCFFRELHKKTGDEKHCKRAFWFVLPAVLIILSFLLLLVSKLC